MDKELLGKILAGLSDKNIRFADMKKIILAIGFNCHVRGSHHIFTMEGIDEIINLQPMKDGKAKPYQVRQVRNLIIKNKLHQEQTDV